MAPHHQRVLLLFPLVFFLLLLLLVAPPRADAWGKEGHIMVCKIAEVAPDSALGKSDRIVGSRAARVLVPGF
jgi:hypothetical protein